MNIYLSVSVAFMVGVIVHAAVAMRKINSATPGIDFNGVLKQYIKTDTWTLVISVLALFVYLIILSEAVGAGDLEINHPAETPSENNFHWKIAGYIKTISIIVGYWADYAVYSFFGRAKKMIDTRLGNNDESKDK